MNEIKNNLKRKINIKNWLKKKKHLIGAKWILFLIFLIITVKLIDFTDITYNLKKLSLLAWSKIIIITLIGKIFYSLRWKIICKKGLNINNITLYYLLRINMLSEFVGIVIPTILGTDGTRILKLGTHINNSSKGVASTVSDRIFGIISLLLLVIILIPRLGYSFYNRLYYGEMTKGVCFSVIFFVIILIGSLMWLIKSYRFDKNWTIQVTKILYNPTLFMLSILISIFGHICLALGQYIPFNELGSLNLIPGIALVLTSQLARSIPISMLGINAGDFSLIALVGLLGVATPIAVCAVIIGLIVRYLFALIGLTLEILYDSKLFIMYFK